MSVFRALPVRACCAWEDDQWCVLLHISPYCTLHALTGVFKWLVGLYEWTLCSLVIYLWQFLYLNQSCLGFSDLSGSKGWCLSYMTFSWFSVYFLIYYLLHNFKNWNGWMDVLQSACADLFVAGAILWWNGWTWVCGFNPGVDLRR